MLPSVAKAVLRFAISEQVRLFESFSPQRFAFYCSLMFGSAELGLPQRPERRTRREEARDAKGGWRAPAGAAARVPAARGDSVPRGGPLALRLGPPPVPVDGRRAVPSRLHVRTRPRRYRSRSQNVHMCWSLVYSPNINYYTTCDFTSRNDWVGVGAAVEVGREE